ncbi:MAG TPA: hypothetical protein VF447_03320, partial [Terriglobales bacterium]
NDLRTSISPNRALQQFIECVIEFEDVVDLPWFPYLKHGPFGLSRVIPHSVPVRFNVLKVQKTALCFVQICSDVDPCFDHRDEHRFICILY